MTERHATTPRFFGSVARGDDEAGSDVDLLVEFTDEASLLDEVGLRLALRDLLQIEVDVVAADALREAVNRIPVDELTANGIMDPARLFESPYTDHGHIDVIFTNDVDVIVDILRDVKAHAVPAEVA